MYKKKFSSNRSLKDLNTFAMDVTAKKIIFIKTILSLIQAWNTHKLYCTPYIILGEGSNVLFLENYKGTVIINRIKGIKIIETKNMWFIHVFSGEKWHDLVKHTLRMGIFGLENLAFIPGCIGSAAIQNIGAYGIEFKHVCQYVDIITLNNGIIKRISAKDCHFSYRNSIFKNQNNHGYAIISVGIKLKKKWRPIIFNSLSNYITPTKITAYKIFHTICKIRKKKLPNPKKIGNAGSFFKNPIIDKKVVEKIQSFYVNVPIYPQLNGLIKISGAWLIEKYKFKNIKVGRASIYKKQKLVLINNKNATSKNIVQLASIIQMCILKKFNVWLEPEVDFIGSLGKVRLLQFENS